MHVGDGVSSYVKSLNREGILCCNVGVIINEHESSELFIDLNYGKLSSTGGAWMSEVDVGGVISRCSATEVSGGCWWNKRKLVPGRHDVWFNRVGDHSRTFELREESGEGYCV